jgi:hypothetical protein
MENPPFIDGFPSRIPLKLGCYIAMFDYHRVGIENGSFIDDLPLFTY